MECSIDQIENKIDDIVLNMKERNENDKNQIFKNNNDLTQ